MFALTANYEWYILTLCERFCPISGRAALRRIEAGKAAAVSNGIGRWHPEKGTFRGWLFTVVRHQIGRAFDRKPHQPQDTHVQQVLAEYQAPDDSDWDVYYERRMLHWAAEHHHPVEIDLHFGQSRAASSVRTDVRVERSNLIAMSRIEDAAISIRTTRPANRLH